MLCSKASFVSIILSSHLTPSVSSVSGACISEAKDPMCSSARMATAKWSQMTFANSCIFYISQYLFWISKWLYSQNSALFYSNLGWKLFSLVVLIFFRTLRESLKILQKTCEWVKRVPCKMLVDACMKASRAFYLRQWFFKITFSCTGNQVKLANGKHRRSALEPASFSLIIRLQGCWFAAHSALKGMRVIFFHDRWADCFSLASIYWSRSTFSLQDLQKRPCCGCS